MGKYKEVIEKLFRIYDKDGNLVDFKLKPIQVEIDRELDEVSRVDILKPRQKGCTSYIMARFLVDCMNSHTIAVMLAHDKDHTEKLLRRAQEFLQNIKGPKPRISRSNENETYFSNTQSQFYIGTAGSKNFGRSATITRLHMSELAFWKDPKGIRVGLLQAVPASGTVVEETTANGYGTWYQKYYYRLMGLTNPKTKPLFYPWNMDNEYSSSTPLSSPYTEDELLLIEKYNLSPEQIQWRREKLEELEFDEALFKQEYPLTIEEAFKFTGGSLFSMLNFEDSPLWKRGLDGFYLEGHPNPDHSYIIGADSSGGTGNDEAAIQVVSVDSMEQVYEFGDNRMAPPQFALKINEIGRLFNGAYVIPEANSHGLSTIQILKEVYPHNRIFRRSISPRLSQSQNVIPSYTYGWETRDRTKGYSIGISQRFLQNGFKIYSPECVSQLRAYTEDADTKLIVNSGDHDDRGMAMLLAFVGIQRAMRYKAFVGQEEKPKTFQDKLEAARASIQPAKWRDAQGNYLVAFKDMFPKRRRNIHLQ